VHSPRNTQNFAYFIYGLLELLRPEAWQPGPVGKRLLGMTLVPAAAVDCATQRFSASRSGIRYLEPHELYQTGQMIQRELSVWLREMLKQFLNIGVTCYVAHIRHVQATSAQVSVRILPIKI
jgi:hypothetical protein